MIILPLAVMVCSLLPSVHFRWFVSSLLNFVQKQRIRSISSNNPLHLSPLGVTVGFQFFLIISFSTA